MQKPFVVLVAIVFAGFWVSRSSAAETPAKLFRAGAHAIDITPQQLPVRISGGFLEDVANQVTDRLHARCLVLDDGTKRLAIVVVDNCMMPRELLDEAKEQARRRTGIPTERMLISATHTHSGPAAMGCLGCRTDTNYTRILPGKIAEGIERAVQNLAPARVGWGVVDDPEHTHTRRWIYRSDQVGTDPFGDRTVRANMHPGHRNPNVIGPSGPKDPGLSMLSVQTRDGRPLALLANYSMHYYGATAVSADYYGRFATQMAKLIGGEVGEPPFVGIMSQGTSGDQMWMDYGQSAVNIGLDAYAQAVAKVAFEGYQKIQYQNWVPLAMAETTLSLRRRTPSEQRLAWAKAITDKMTNDLARTIPEVYALEAFFLHREPIRELKLQALRIGELGITAIPNEVYAITGLKLKAWSPLQPTFNIELANGAEGYIPTPEQHKLGGYTTWPARTAALEETAEPKIVETVLGLLERVAGRPRRTSTEPHGAYARTVLAAKPIAYWRLGEFNGRQAVDATGNHHEAFYEDGIAFHLPGPESARFTEPRGANTSAHFAGGRLKASFPELADAYSVEFWFWNGFPTQARGVTGYLFSRGTDGAPSRVGDYLSIGGTNGAPGQLVFASGLHPSSRALTGQSRLRRKTWNHVAIVRRGSKVEVFLNGRATPDISGDLAAEQPDSRSVFFGGRSDGAFPFEGKLDEVAVYARALAIEEIVQHYHESGEGPRDLPSALSVPETDGPYARAVLASQPLAYWRLGESGSELPTARDATGHEHSGAYEEEVEFAAEGPGSGQFSGAGEINRAPRFVGGRLKAVLKGLGATYSVSLWFWNELPNRARAVTGYCFSRGLDGATGAPGDHLGLGGTHQDSPGRLLFFNGNKLDQALRGKQTIEPKTWNHVVLVREEQRVTVYLNGGRDPEIAGEAAIGATAGVETIFLGGRNDNFANWDGRLDEVAVYNRALSAEDAVRLYRASGMPTVPGSQ